MPFNVTRNNPKPVPTKEELLDKFSEDFNTSHLLASLEYTLDLVMDMTFMMFDIMVQEGKIVLTSEETAIYEEFKLYQSELHTFSLSKGNFPDGSMTSIEYIYFFKQKVLQARQDYYNQKQELGLNGIAVD